MLSYFNGDGARLPDFVINQQKMAAMFKSQVEKQMLKQKSREEATIKVDQFKQSMLEKIREQKNEWQKRLNKRADLIGKPVDSISDLVPAATKEEEKSPKSPLKVNPVEKNLKVSLKDKIMAMRQKNQSYKK